ncbi:MAG: hypothetical protein IKA09_12980 [Lachnospiraceae bacterium]|nr:hypothetical protein [Lachnospiraceae bacterium]
MKYYQKWEARAIRPDGASEWFAAEVPGNIQYDYGKFMGWGDINVAENVIKFRETEGYTWEYRTQLAYSVRQGEKAVFVSEGIDYFFEILIDGITICQHEGMFTRIEVDLTEHIGKEMIIRIYPHPKDEIAKFGDRDEAAQCVKPPVCYGWDWHPRMLVSGIWQEAYVEVRKREWIYRCEPFYSLNEDLTKAIIEWDIEADGSVEIELRDPDGNVIGTGDHFEIENPRLWWCNGQGEPALYTYSAKTHHHEVTGHIGLRSVKLVMNEGAWKEPKDFPKGRSVAPIQIELNGRKVFAKGSNWVNPDIYNGRIDEARYKALITLAKDANMNILRCWGGSGINKGVFYDLCDRLGIMVWVEFPLACNNYRQTPHYLEVLEQEASAIIKNLRRHPSVVMYCGGNELFNSWSKMTDQSLALRLLNKLCYDLDAERPFIMTSPIYGMGHGGYTFLDRSCDKDVFTLFQDSRCTAYTEFGVSGITDVETLKKIIPEDELFPIENKGSWRLHHAFGAWGEDCWLCMDVLTRYTQEPLDTLEKIVDHATWLQCEGYKAIFEEARRQAPYCSMAINWCYCEPWITAAGNSLITYPVQIKPAYYAVQSALRPIMASARIPRFNWKGGECFRAELWLLNDGPTIASETIKVFIRLNDVEYPLLTWESGEVKSNSNKIGPSVNWILPDVAASSFSLILDTGNGASSEYTLCYRPRKGAIHTRQMNV